MGEDDMAFDVTIDGCNERIPDGLIIEQVLDQRQEIFGWKCIRIERFESGDVSRPAVAYVRQIDHGSVIAQPRGQSSPAQPAVTRQ
jgi:hypothetical protein